MGAIHTSKLSDGVRLDRGSPGAVGLKGDPQAADTVGMKLRRSVLALLLLVGVFAATPASASMRSGADRPRCRTEVYRPPGPATRILEFIVTAAGRRLGAVGVWEHRSRGSVTIRVDPGDGKAHKVLEGRSKRAYDLVRCETVR